MQPTNETDWRIPDSRCIENFRYRYTTPNRTRDPNTVLIEQVEDIAKIRTNAATVTDTRAFDVAENSTNN